MTDLLVLGTVALDSIETPFGKAKDALGGSASYASYAASFFCTPAVLSIIGSDFPKEYLQLLKKRGVVLDCVTVADKTFRWSGYYEYDLNEAKTLKTELNALAHFTVKLPEAYTKIKFVYLANIDPDLQISVMEQLTEPQLIVMDTMNFWITSKKETLLKAISKTNVIILNDGEARQLFATPNLIKAATLALGLGPRCVIIKKGEHGALMFMDGKHFSAPSYPLEIVKDPTGAGDSFGGGFTGYLAKTKDLSEKNFRKAVIYGSVLASYNTEDFSLTRLSTLTQKEIDARYEQMKDIREF